MTIVVQLKPEVEARLREEAEKAGKSVEELAAAWIAERSRAPAARVHAGQMTPTEAIAYWDREGMHPNFDDGSDSSEMVLKWRKDEEKRPGQCGTSARRGRMIDASGH